MDHPLTLLARAFDTKGYPDDKNPNNWRTINGAKTHINEEGKIDGGAGGKFHGRPWTSTKHPFVPKTPPKPETTVDDLKNAWKKVIAAQVNMKRAKSEATYKKHAAAVIKAIDEYEKLRNEAPASVKSAHNPKIALARASAGKPYKSLSEAKPAAITDPIETLREATETGTPKAPFPIFSEEKRRETRICKTPAESDKILRGPLTKLWNKATEGEKLAAFTYSYSFKQFQEPLRGTVYGTGRKASWKTMPWDTLGVATMGKKRGEVKKYIQDLTSFIDKSSYDKDIKLVRYSGYDGVAALFGVDAHWLRTASIDKINEKLNDARGKDEGFTSCGSSVGHGLSDKDVVIHVDCPAGTKMLYLEPFAAYGGDSPYSASDLRRMYSLKKKPNPYWDGKSEQKKFGDQDETLIQRGTTFQCTGAKRQDGKLHIYMQVVCQEPTPIK